MGTTKIKQKSKVKNKSFYIALSVCLVAFLISFFAAVGQLKGNSKQSQKGSTSTPSTTSNPLQDANKPVSDVPAASNSETTATPTDTQQSDSIITGTTPIYSFPVSGKITKQFDNKALQYSKTYSDWRLHLGVDITADAGTPIYSCSYGTVEDIYEDRALGTVIAIDHGEGLMAYYCGLNPATVASVDDEVQPGTQLGILGTVPSECAEETHLHFAMEKDGVPISPLSILQS